MPTKNTLTILICAEQVETQALQLFVNYSDQFKMNLKREISLLINIQIKQILTILFNKQTIIFSFYANRDILSTSLYLFNIDYMTQRNKKGYLPYNSFTNTHNFLNKPIYNSIIEPNRHPQSINHPNIHSKYTPLHFRSKNTTNHKQYFTQYQSQFIQKDYLLSNIDLDCSKRQKSQKFNISQSQTARQSSNVSPKVLKRQYLTINTQTPKLRQSNSTRCQSPIANQSFVISKLSEFHKIKLLGSGKFGDVHLVMHKKTGFIAALKIINKKDLLIGTEKQKQNAMIQMIRQIKLQSFLNHPNLIKLYDCWSDWDNIYLLLELACDGQLLYFLEKSKTFSEETTSIVVREILEGINYMHCHDVIHRDVKLQNIVISHGMAKICDFGWSVHCPKQFRNTLCGTPLYLSPQILAGKQYNKKIDIWALGALTHELFSAQNPFKIKNKQQLFKIITEDFQITKGSPQLKNFIILILNKDPSKRPDTKALKTHPFIEKYKDLQTSDELCLLGSIKK